MLDFNDAPEQKVSSGPIPPDSVVKVRLVLRQPKDEYALPEDPMIFQASSGLLGLDCEFEVVGGSFAGKHIWENLWLPPNMQQIQLSKGQHGACEGGVAKMRAILEAARNISPSDQSQAARNARTMRAWNDLNGLEFGVVVGVQKIKAGDQYVNNSIKKIVTPDDERYQHVMSGGEIISDKPVPELPTAPQATAPTSAMPKPGGLSGAKPAAAPVGPNTNWGQGRQQSAPQGAAQRQPQAHQNAAQRPAMPKTAQGPRPQNSPVPQAWEDNVPPPPPAGHPAMDEVPW